MVKNLRIGGVAAAATLGLVASLSVAAPASAATIYVTADDIGVEGETYPDGWFTGIDPAPETLPQSTDEGLDVTGRTILLNGGVDEGADLAALVESAAVEASGDWTFQIPVFLDNANGEGFTTFRPAVPNSVATDTQWISSRAVGELPANTPVAFSEVVAAFEAGDDEAVLAYGIIVDTGQTATLRSVTWGEDTSIFTPEPQPEPQPIAFNDIANNTFKNQIDWLSTRGITTGYLNSDGSSSYRPSEAVLREQMAAFLYRYVHEGENPATSDPVSTFGDVPVNHAFTRHIAWLAGTGITEGYTGNTFRGGQPVLREQMAAFLYRLAGEPDVNLPARSPFIDVPTSHTFYKQIVWLSTTAVTEGYYEANGQRSFRGSQPVLREQMAAFLFRYDELPIPAAR